MATTPNLRSYQQILQDKLNVFIARSGVNDVNVASALRSIFEASSMSDFRSQGDIIAALNSTDIDRATGADLDKIGFSKGVLRPQASSATGVVTIFSTNFSKISTKVYAGSAAPPAGVFAVNVSDASTFPTSGSIYIGRGTTNLEGPLAYSSITPIGSYFQINLVSPTTKNHNLSEAVVLAQGGNRVVNAGTLVQTARNETSQPVQYRVAVTSTIPDGETSLTNVPVVCTQLGSIGNAPANAIVEFSPPPFLNAGVTNPSAYVTGADKTTDRDYRQLIKNTEQTRTKGTALAIQTAAVGVRSTDDNKVVASANIRVPANRNEPATLFVDDGTAYQPIFSGQGFEQVVDHANGGEKFLQLQHEDITKALLLSVFSAPFALTGGMELSIKVGGVLSQHQFDDGDFATPNAADTFEIVNSINANTSLLFNARAVTNSTKIAVFAKAFTNEDLQAIDPNDSFVNANQFLGLSENLNYSLRLYKNDKLLIKDGAIPTIISAPQSAWNPMSSPQTLILAIDTTPAVTYTFVDADFVPVGLALLSATAPLTAWATVLTNKIPGITVTVQGNQLIMQSNKGANNLAYLGITGGTLVTNGMFTALEGLTSQGKASDYALNRSTGQIELTADLAFNDTITAGSKNTRAFTDSAKNPTGSVILGSSPTPRIWVVVDSPSVNEVVALSPGLNVVVSNPSGNQWRYTASATGAFSNVAIGDWAIFADTAFAANNKGYWRVTAFDSSLFTWIEVTRTTGTAQSINLISGDGIYDIRTDGGIQEIPLPVGLQTLSTVALAINATLLGASASVVNATVIRINTNTFKEIEGTIAVVGVNDSSRALGFTVGLDTVSSVSHTAFDESNDTEFTIPDFVVDTVATGTGSIPPNTIVTTTNLSTIEDPNRWLSFLDGYTRISSNKGLYAQVGNYSGTTVTLVPNPRMRDVLNGDRYFVGVPYDFDSNDNLVAILDGDSVNKSLNIKLSRGGTVNGSVLPTTTVFRAYDSEAGPTADYPQSFGNNFSFNNFKIHFHARQVMDPAGASNAMLVRHVTFGPTGNQTQVGIFYPRTPGATLGSIVLVGSLTQIQIFLASGPQRLGGAWDNTTQINVTNPVGSTFRYAYSVGTAPAFVSSAGVSVNDIVTIDASSNFNAANQGTFKVTAVTDAYFEVSNPSGVVEGPILLNNPNDFVFYSLLGGLNTASLIGAYANTTLSNYISISQLESGAGVVTTSTFADTGNDYINLVDGENWILASAIGTSLSPTNQFTLKVPLTVTNPLYSLVGEPFKLLPTITDHIVRFLNTFSVTGLSSLGNLVASDNASKPEIFSNLFGSSGSVQVSGGTANDTNSAITGSGSVVDSIYTKFSISKNNILGFHSGQWLKIANTASQAKTLGLNATSTIQVQASTPISGEATITLGVAGTFQVPRTHSGDATTVIRVEKQGQFACVSWTGAGTNPNFSGGGVQEGDWVWMKGIFSSLNRGIFKVEKTYGSNTFWIVNPNLTEGNYTLSSNNDLKFYTYDSVMPGDKFNVAGNVLGTPNAGSFTVLGDISTGANFPTATTLVVAGDMVNVGPVALAAFFTQVTVLEKSPFVHYKKIKNFALDPNDPAAYDVITYGNFLAQKINVAAGSFIDAVSKFAFNTNVQVGEDSYKFYGGLIHAVGQVIRGEASDPVAFPGVAASGSFIDIDSPLPKKIVVSIVIKNQTGTPFTILKGRVQSAVSALINAYGVGQPVIFSDIVTAAGSINGVQAVAISSPLYDATHELIPSSENEKPVVLNASTDIIVSLPI